MKRCFRFLLAVGFVFAGVSHFYAPDFYLPLMPAYFPWHRELVLISGAFEIILGALVLVPRCQRLAGIGLVLLLLAVFPANIHLATHPELYPSASNVERWGRLPLQAVFIVWVWWACELK